MPRKRQKEKQKDVSSILKAIASVDEAPEQSASQLFYASISARAEQLSRREQSQLQLEVLQLVYDYEFGDKNYWPNFVTERM